MAGVDEIAAAKDCLDHGLPVKLSAPGLDDRHQLLISLPRCRRSRFPFRSALNLLIHVRAPDRSLGSLADAFCVRYHLEFRGKLLDRVNSFINLQDVGIFVNYYSF